MILSKDNNNNWTPTAGGTGTFIGTLAAFNAIKDTLPVNTIAYITDDGNGDLQPVDAITDGNMHPVTSNAVYDKLKGLSMANSGTKMIINEASGPEFMSCLEASSTNASSPEGGEIDLGRAPNSTHITGRIAIDVYNDTVRFFCGYDGQVRMFTIDFGTKTTYWN